MYLSFIYILLLVVGVAWIVYRVKKHIRAERQREQDLGALFSDDRFKSYLEVLKNRNGGKSGPETNV